MKAYFLSFVIGLGVGVVYALLRVKSPAPPLVALVGLLGMVFGEAGYACLKTMIQYSSAPHHIDRSHGDLAHGMRVASYSPGQHLCSPE